MMVPGKTSGALAPREAGVTVADIPLRGPSRTLYLQVGNVFGWGCTILTVLAAGWLILPARHRGATRAAATGTRS
jgi:apolipoprotein N-acyltransferase